MDEKKGNFPIVNSKLNELKITSDNAHDYINKSQNIGDVIINTSIEYDDVTNNSLLEYLDSSNKFYNELSDINISISKRMFFIIIPFIGLFYIYRMTFYYKINNIDLEYFVLFIILLISIYVVDHFALKSLIMEINDLSKNFKNDLEKKDTSYKNKIKNLKLLDTVKLFKTHINNLFNVFVSLNDNLIKTMNVFKQQNTCIRVIESIISFSKRYSIYDKDDLKKHLMSKFYLGSEEDVRDNYISDFSKIGNFDFFSIKLLYFDYLGLSHASNILWDNISDNDQFIINFINFTNKFNILNYKQLDLDTTVNLLKNIKYFSLNNVQYGIYNILNIYDDLEIIINTSKMENIVLNKLSFYIILKSNISLFKNYLSDSEVYNILFYYVNQAIIDEFDEKIGIIKCLLAMSPIQSTSLLRKYANVQLGNEDTGVDIVFTYSILKELRKEENVTLKDAVLGYKAVIKNHKRIRKLQWDELKKTLQDGVWIDSLRYISFNILKNLEKDIGDLSEEKETLQSLRNVAKSYLSQNTIMHVLESNSIVAYIIMANTKKGNIMPFIDEIKLVDKNNMFWFEKYTNSARLGIIPTGMTFNEFANIFMSKLPVDSRNYISNIVMHRFPSELSSKQVTIGEEYEEPWMIIRKLIYRHIDTKKISTYLKYSVMINESFIHKSLYEIIRDYIIFLEDNKYDEIKSILEDNDILSELYDEFNVNNMRELINLIYQHKNKKTNELKIIKVMNKYFYNYDQEFVNNLSNFILNRLIDFGIVAKSIKTDVI